MSCDWNGPNSKCMMINNWRASLVPAAAVIPAPIAYIKVVAVKKLVVGFRRSGAGDIFVSTGPFGRIFERGFGVPFTGCPRSLSGLL